jgi:hypothetical protein
VRPDRSEQPPAAVRPCAVTRMPPRHAAAAAVAVMLAFPGPIAADWDVITRPDAGSQRQTPVAVTANDHGYSLEIYRDSVGAIRSRFTLPPGLYRLSDRSCPTFQIDRGAPINRSVNDAPCLQTERWAEFVVGYVEDSRVISSRLLAFMNGIDIAFRFRLSEGGYRETTFSLLGSKRSMTAAIGSSVTVVAP